MSIVYKVDVIQKLKDAGYSTYRIMKDRLLTQTTMTQIRHGKPISFENLERLCKLLNCQPGDIIEYKEDET